MSSKKDKYIESAQKFLIKGQLEKAVVDLEQAVALDPGDLKVRQRLAEILVRVNRQTDAISQYDTIGKSFANSGFYLKAIAVYKQIQKLDPENTKVTLTLAELNVNHGLIGNALAEFSLVVNHYLKTGKQPEALSLLERMLEIDPSNLNTMLKIAETLLAAGNSEDAYERYCHLAQQLWTRPDKTPFYRLCDRIKTLFPDKGCAVLRFVSSQLERGETAEAFASLKEIITHSPDNFDAWMLMADTVRTSGDTGQLVSILEKIEQRFPDELRPKETLIELALSFQEIDRSLDLLDDFRSLFIEKNHPEKLEGYYNEIQSLVPSDKRSLEALCCLFEQTGDKSKMAEADERLKKLLSCQDKTETPMVEAEPIAEPDDKTSIQVENEKELQELAEISETISRETELSDWEEEIELDLDELPEQEPATPAPSIETIEFEPFPEFPAEPQKVFEPLQELPTEDLEQSMPADEIAAEPIEELEPIQEAPYAHNVWEQAPAPLSETPSDMLTEVNEPEETEEDIFPELSSDEVSELEIDLSGDIEPAEFFSAEEDELSDRILLEIANPLPITAFIPEESFELPAELELEPEPEIELPSELDLVAETEIELPVDLELEPETEIELPVELEPEIVLPVERAAEVASVSPWDEISSDDNIPSSVKTSLPPAEELMDMLVGHLESFDWTATDNRSTTAVSSTDEMELEILSDSDEGSISSPEAAFELEDLASFSEALFGEEISTHAEDPESEQYSLGNLLSAFKKGVDEQIDESDTESHYNLGIAYKEMGLFEEAIHEFRSAGHDPQRAADCITLQGICLREKGDMDSAESTFRQGLDLPVLSSESLLNLKYELALLLEQADRPDEALNYYQEIIRVNHSYRDVSHHIARLSGEDDLDILIELKEEGD